jgi:hypothetical protein
MAFLFLVIKSKSYSILLPFANVLIFRYRTLVVRMIKIYYDIITIIIIIMICVLTIY